MIQYARDDNFRELIGQGAVVVDFYGKHCAPCRLLAKVLDEIDDEFPFLQIVKADVEACPGTAEAYGITGIPDLYFYKDGVLIAREPGAVSENVIRGHLAGILY